MKTLKFIISRLLKWRYLIAVVFFVIGVSFQLHGSSISNWNNFGVTETTQGKKIKTINQFTQSEEGAISIPHELKNWISLSPREDGTLIGVPRMIRTDEWLVQTPFYISQSNTGAKLVNDSYGIDGQNMMIAYNAPVKDISVVGKPFNWGFLFLGPNYGLSWYWCLKIILFLLVSFEFSLILTKRNTFISLIGSLWITFTPATQWWFMQHLGDVVFYSLAIMVLIYHYFRQKKVLRKIGIALLLTMSIIGFVLIIYPAFQVTFAYIILAFLLIEIYLSIAEKRFSKFDFGIMIATLISSFAVIGITLLRSKEAIDATLNTVYPGHRVSSGGAIGLERLSDVFLNPILPFKIPNFSNQVEVSTSISLFPMSIVTIPFVFKKSTLKDNLFGYFLLIYSLFLCIYTFLGIPESLAKLSLFSYVTSGRSWQTLAVVSVFLSIWLIAYLWEKRQDYSPVILGLISFLVVTALALQTYFSPDYIGFIGKKYLLLISFALLTIYLSVIFKRKWLLLFSLLPFIIVSGMTVNPVVKGIDVLIDKRLSQGIIGIVKKDPESKWISEGGLYNFPQMFGAHSLNSVRFYPDKTLMHKLDTRNSYENAWNRYSHMQVFLTKNETRMEAPVPDVLNVQLGLDKLDSLHVKYVLTHRDLEKEYGSKFQVIYGPDKDGIRIFRIDNRRD
ncbi:DUF7657 domain-containing protein [Streptococcus uberis]|uniref:DUF7657 domain-containing protein n=1 Tax=Streptococcus uberis TaxID=1349 RepID=UPI0005423F97|nr:hypothetical protein [Streptococcus uberis]KHD41201.1 membrane protein [Streptococcus hongkongensis]MBI0907379.1 hypothetical protein [Streptococcus uberis]MCR4256991.1 hypothetical protein [Streptococcus uberis]MEE3697708.1 hypothetical protein [Streptococcus uberis]MEE3737910.1 hypothetical protein [Streptococcus uberis]